LHLGVRVALCRLLQSLLQGITLQTLLLHKDRAGLVDRIME
jgi:hypothetical protein